MNRVWTALILLATIVVAGAVGYVLVHDDKVPEAGRTPGFSAAAASSGAPRSSGAPQSSGASTSHSASTDPGAVRIAFLGDNWVTGAGVDHDTHKRFADQLADALDAKYSVFGADGSGYAKRGPGGKNFGDLASKVIDDKPDMVVVCGGRNDVSDDADTLSNDAKSLFADLKEKLPDATLVAVAPFWGDSDHPGDLTKVDTAVKKAVQAAGGTYLDIPDPLKGHSDWMADEANPNAKGNDAIAGALEPKLKDLLG